MPFSRNQKIILGFAAAIILFFVLVFLGVIPGLRKNSGPQIKAELEFWGVADEAAVYQPVIDKFAALNPGIKINYRQFAESSYEKELINALAADRGPDIFMLHHLWLSKHYDKILPLPSAKLNFDVYRQQLFPQIVEQDFSSQNTIYAFPLSIDTLAMFYNRDLFDQSGVALVPTTWAELQNIIPQLRLLDSAGRIVRAGAALGGSNQTIDKATDIFSLLMLQYESLASGQRFNSPVFGFNSGSHESALKALNFYTGFAQPLNFNYTWNEAMPFSAKAFSEKATAIIFNYGSSISVLKKTNPSLNVAVAPMPQFNPAASVNYADYWGYTVSKKTFYPDLAWNFILFLTTNQESAKSYLQATGRSPALRFLIQEKINDPEMGLFCRQALTARSWVQYDNTAVAESLSNMIKSVISGGQSVENALRLVEEQIREIK